MCTLPIENTLHSMRSPQKEGKEKEKGKEKKRKRKKSRTSGSFKERTRRPFCHDSSSRLEEL